jgi:hypothetical protein
MTEPGQHSTEGRDEPADVPNAPTEQDQSEEGSKGAGRSYPHSPSETDVPRQQDEG